MPSVTCCDIVPVIEGKICVETRNAVLLGTSLSVKNCSFHGFQWTQAERAKMISGFVLLCLSWLQILFERPEINVREKPSSSVCHPVNTVQLRTQASTPAIPWNVSCVHGKRRKSKREPIVF